MMLMLEPRNLKGYLASSARTAERGRGFGTRPDTRPGWIKGRCSKSFLRAFQQLIRLLRWQHAQPSGGADLDGRRGP